MAEPTTTLRVPTAFPNRLRIASQERQRSMTDTLVDALDALRREEFFDAMEEREAQLRADLRCIKIVRP